MKPFELALIAFVLLAVFALTLTACSLSAPGDISADVVRIHIRANSNDDADQSVKLLVRDAVTEYLGIRLSDCKSKDDALSLLTADEEKLSEIANTTLKANGFDYKSAVLVKTDYFPEKAYGDYVFPAGRYDALMILLGTGEGDNWWCVAFPPLCFFPDGDGEEIVYKSWVKELLDKIFKKR